jgi:hypothetical protein
VVGGGEDGHHANGHVVVPEKIRYGIGKFEKVGVFDLILDIIFHFYVSQRACDLS